MNIEEYYRKRNIREVGQQHQRHISSSHIVVASSLSPPKSSTSYHNNSVFGKYCASMFGGTTIETKATSSDEESEDIDEESPVLNSRWTSRHRHGDANEEHLPMQRATKVVSFRQILPKDRVQIQTLHEEWFPVEYQQEFYDELCLHRRMCKSGHALFTLVATVPMEPNSHADSCVDDEKGVVIHSSCPLEEQPHDSSDERIVACLVGCILSAHKLNRKSRELLVPDFPHRHSKLFYIMTLGTVKEYRHMGLASQLVEQVITSVVQKDVELGTVYLHVITMNDAAIRFYEDKLGFWKVQEIQGYYIDGNPYNCYLYANYFHGNRGHLSLFKVFSRWISTFWSSLSLSHMAKSRLV